MPGNRLGLLITLKNYLLFEPAHNQMTLLPYLKIDVKRIFTHLSLKIKMAQCPRINFAIRLKFFFQNPFNLPPETGPTVKLRLILILSCIIPRQSFKQMTILSTNLSTN